MAEVKLNTLTGLWETVTPDCIIAWDGFTEALAFAERYDRDPEAALREEGVVE
jgi:hypothetical protein